MPVLEFLSALPTNIWKWLKGFVKSPRVTYSDPMFYTITRVLPYIICGCTIAHYVILSLRDVDISCHSKDNPIKFGSDGGGSGFHEPGKSNLEMDNFCWNRGTFLVKKALDPANRQYMTEPGISGYIRGVDELVSKKYYGTLWTGLGISGLVAFVFNYFWRTEAVKRVESILNASLTVEATQRAEHSRAQLFNEAAGFNDSFGHRYLIWRVLSTFIPPAILGFLIGFIGQDYTTYGVDVVVYWFSGSEAWPNPMDSVFPLITKCEYTVFGYTGDIEILGALCQLPMNMISRYTLLGLWWILVVLSIFSLLHLIVTLRYCCPRYRHRIYRAYLTTVCSDDIAVARKYVSRRTGQEKEHKIRDVIQLRIGFGDWLLLYLLKKNLTGFQFRNFIDAAANPEGEHRLPFISSGFRIRNVEEMAAERFRKKQRRLTMRMSRLRRSNCVIAPAPSAPASAAVAAGWVVPPPAYGFSLQQAPPTVLSSAAPGIQALQEQLLGTVNPKPAAARELLTNSMKLPPATATVAPGIQALQNQLLTAASVHPKPPPVVAPRKASDIESSFLEEIQPKMALALTTENETAGPSVPGPRNPRRPRCPVLKPEPPPQPKPRKEKTVPGLVFQSVAQHTVSKAKVPLDKKGHLKPVLESWETKR